MKKLLCACFLAAFSLHCWAGEDEEKARALFDQHQKAVVTVQLVIKQKISFPGAGSQDNEDKAEITGTIISPDGLTVVALSDTDPTSMFSNFMSDEMSDQFKMEATISDVKILTEDSKEIEAGVVLRDKDLDLAFVRPKAKPEHPLPYVDCTQGGTARVLDRVATINRLGKVANRTASLSLEYIEAIVAKPRTFYFPGGAATMTGTGCPAFTLEGKLLGVFVTRTLADKSGGFDPSRSHSIVVLPAADIQEGASQAPPFGQEPQEAPASAPAADVTPEESK